MLNLFRSLYPLLFIFLVACSQVDEPELSDIKNHLQQTMPAPWQIESLDIAAEENIGSKTEPAWQYRLIVEMTPTEALYKWLTALDTTSVLKPLREKGDKKTVHIISKSVFNNGQWLHRFNYDVDPFREEGSVASSLVRGDSDFVVFGTSEYNDLLEKAKKAIKKSEVEVDKLKTQLNDLKQQQNELVQDFRKEEAEKIKQIRKIYAVYQEKTRTLNTKIYKEKQAIRSRERPAYDKKLRALDTAETKKRRGIAAKYKPLEKVELNKINKMDAVKRKQRIAILNKYDPLIQKSSGTKQWDLKDAFKQELADLDALYKQKMQPLRAAYDNVLKKRDQDMKENYDSTRKKMDAINKEYYALEKKLEAELMTRYEPEKKEIEAPYQQAQKELETIRTDFKKKNDKLIEQYRANDLLLSTLNRLSSRYKQSLLALSQVQ